jgi:uncharacterized repeat protein (TIGR01451 family)
VPFPTKHKHFHENLIKRKAIVHLYGVKRIFLITSNVFSIHQPSINMSHRTFTNLRFLFILLFGSLFLNSNAQSALNAALKHFDAQKSDLGLSEADIQNFRISDQYTSRHNGVAHLYLQQQYEGINLVNAITNFNILPNGKVLSMGNRFVGNLASKVNTTSPIVSPKEAVEAMIAHFKIETFSDLILEREMNSQHFIFKKEGIAIEPINVKLMYQPINNDEEVRLVWQVDIYELDGQNWRVASVDAVKNKVISHYNQVVSCDFIVDNPDAECTHHNHNHSHQANNRTAQENVMPSMVIDNAYNVYPLPLESPYNGDQQLVISPADDVASPYGWHDVDGEDGHEFTITRGNNVHAYQDIFSLNQPIGDEPDGGDTLVFDIPYDETNFAVFEQRDASIVNLFYWNNVIHDIWYHYGFDEPSGNFQQNNYGNGGLGNDQVQAQSLDGSGTNNANFATPPDGTSGRMQMYFWGAGQTAGPPRLNVLEPASVAGKYPFGKAFFGGNLPDTLQSQAVLVNDLEGNPADACQQIVNSDEINGRIALIDRGGGCDHLEKATKAQNAGAIAVIFCNDADEVYSPWGGFNAIGIQIPLVTMGQSDCETIKMGVADSLVVQIIPAQFVDDIPDPGPNGRDSGLDNGVIIHEYAHGVSNRLTGGPSQSGCLSNQEQMGEGWSDWFALVMTLTADAIGSEPRGIGNYSDGQPVDGPGIRNFPYSTDLIINPQTYSSVVSTNVPHGVGEIWAVTIWDLYWKFIEIYGFDEDFYKGTGGNNMVMQLVLDGLKFQACNPTFIDGRDAILAADVANYNGEHECLIWEIFARRGMGYSAEPGGNEAFDQPPFCVFTVKVNKEAEALVDAGDIISYTLTIRNDKEEILPNAIVEDQLPQNATFVMGSSTCGGTVTDGVLSIPLNDLATGDEVICTYQMQTEADVMTILNFEDDVEGSTSIWSKKANIGSSIWVPNGTHPNSGSRAWKAGNSATVTDLWLTLKEAIPLTGESPALTFWHYYRTQQDFDGGVVEISTDDGENWEDLGAYFVINGYDNTLIADTTNQLAGRPAFTGNSGEHIQSIADLSAYKGESVILRFRFATNDGGGGEGWFVDDIRIYDELEVVVNEVCINDNTTDEICSSAGTVVMGDAVNTTEILPQSAVKLFPNPTNGNITLQWTDQLSEVASVQLFSLDGRALASWNVDGNTGNLSLDIAEFGKGVFMLQILSNNQLITKKVVVK